MGFLDTIFGNKKKKIEASLQKEPTVDKVLELSSLYIQEGDVSSALRLLRAWAKKFNDEKLKSTLHDVEKQERRQEIGTLQNRVKEAPNPLNYSRLASLKIKEGEIDEAMGICKESLEKFPQFNTGAHQCLGDIYIIKEDYQNAAKEYEQVIKEDSNNFQVIKNLCEIYIYNGNVNKAIEYLQDLIKKNPADQTLKDMLERAKAGEQLVEEKEEEAPAPVPQAVVEAPPAMTAAPASPSREPSTSLAASAVKHIFAVTDPEGKAEQLILEKDEFIVGRHQSADLTIDDGKNFISRKHACFRKVGSGYQVSDMGSGNGTFVNGNKLAGPHDLKANDIIKVGYYTFVYMPSGGNLQDDFDATMLDEGDATIVGQEFSYFEQSPAPETKVEKVSLSDEVNRLGRLKGVMQVLVINSSGFPVHSADNQSGLNEQKASALMAHMFSVAEEKTDVIDIHQVVSCDVITDKYSIYLYSSKGYVVSVVGGTDCPKGQIDIEIQTLLKGL